MRFFPLLAVLLLLASCYQPLYGDKGFGSGAGVSETRLNAIEIAGIANEDGQVLRNALIDRMYGSGRPDKTSAVLVVNLTRTIEDLGLQKDATTLRKKITYTADYTLTDKASNKPILTGKSVAFGAYNYLNAQYAALVSKESAADRALTELANLIVTRVLLAYGTADHAPPEAAPAAAATPPKP